MKIRPERRPRDDSVIVRYAPAPMAHGLVRDFRISAGKTVAEIVAEVVPGLPMDARLRCRIVLVTPRGSEVVTADAWHRVRPRAGVTVLIRPVAGKSLLRTVLMVAVAIAAVSLGQLWGTSLALGIFGGGVATAAQVGFATALITTVAGIGGMLLVNALVPVPKPRQADRDYGGYALTGFRNQSTKNASIPYVLGRIRMAPPYAVPPYTEIVGDVQYLRVVFCWGYGPLALSDLKIGDTSITEYDEFEIEHRLGYETDDALSLVTETVLEEGLSVELTRAWELDDDGDYADSDTTIEKPIVRYTASDTLDVSIILGMPGGLYKMSSEGDRRSRTVDVRIRQRPLGSGEDWQDVTTLQVVAARSVPIWRQYRWRVPTRGAWEIEVTRMTDESKSTSVSDRVVWQALQSIRPEYPIGSIAAPLALTAMRIKATAQLNGGLDNFTAVASRIAPDWDDETGTWITRETRSPASAMRQILQGAAAAYPVADAGIDVDQLADWSTWCAANSLKYDRVHDFGGSLADALTDATSAGRAHPRHDGVRYGVVIDRPRHMIDNEPIVEHFSSRNIVDFQWQRTYPKMPDGLRIAFSDATDDYKSGERIVPRPGLSGDVQVTESLTVPGVVDPDQIFLAGTRRFLEIAHRPDTYQVTVAGQARAGTRGDVVALSIDTLSRVQVSARVAAVSGSLVLLDEEVEVEDGVAYAIRYRTGLSEADTIGQSVICPVTVPVSGGKTLILAGDQPPPVADDIVHIGPAGALDLLCIVMGTEAGTDGATVYYLVDAAPEIDDALDATTVPPWDGRAGGEIGIGTDGIPAVPVITGILHGITGTDDANGLVLLLQPGSGAVTVTEYEVDHRLVGSAVWTTTRQAAGGGVTIPGYVAGQHVEMQARAISAYGRESANTAIVARTIGAADPVVPDVTSLSVVRLSSGTRRYSVEIGETPDDVTLAGYRLRARPGSGWTWDDLSPLHSGYLTGSPWESSNPLAEGSYTIGAVAVAVDGAVSRTPMLVTATLGPSYGSGVLVQRIESALGWPGTLTGGSVVGDGLEGSDGATYVLPVIDLGSDRAIAVQTETYDVSGTATVTMRTGLDIDGAPLDPPAAAGSATARYVELTVTMTGTGTLSLGDLVTIITSGE